MMKTLGAAGALALAMVFVAGPAQAQQGYRGGMTGSQFQLVPSADATAYYIDVHYSGYAIPEVLVRQYGQVLDVTVGQGGGMGGGFFTNRMSQRFQLPPDADFSRLQRRAEPGRISVMVPRRQPPLSRW